MLDFNDFKDILEEQEYLLEDVRKSIIKTINDKDNDNLFNIWCALSDNVGETEVKDFIESFISDYVIPEFPKELAIEYDAVDLAMEIVDRHISEFYDLNANLSSYGEKQLESWRLERISDNQDYRCSVL